METTWPVCDRRTSSHRPTGFSVASIKGAAFTAKEIRAGIRKTGYDMLSVELLCDDVDRQTLVEAGFDIDTIIFARMFLRASVFPTPAWITGLVETTARGSI